MSGIRTILADGAVAVRDTIAQLLALEPDIDVLGEYDDGHAALAAARAIACGARFVDLDIADEDVIDIAGDRTWRADPVRTPLTARERRVLSAVSRCRSTRELCETVGRSPAGDRRHGDVHAAGKDRRTGQVGRGTDRDHPGMAPDRVYRGPIRLGGK
jgi:hypothetical protein